MAPQIPCFSSYIMEHVYRIPESVVLGFTASDVYTELDFESNLKTNKKERQLLLIVRYSSFGNKFTPLL